jgi:hypothetical protein
LAAHLSAGQVGSEPAELREKMSFIDFTDKDIPANIRFIIFQLPLFFAPNIAPRMIRVFPEMQVTTVKVTVYGINIWFYSCITTVGHPIVLRL